jgi:glucan phosphoethanolaminetransferase (alkaline phosphatase superfamily)
MKEKIQYRFSIVSKIIIVFAMVLILLELWQIRIKYADDKPYLFQVLSILSLLLLIGAFILKSRIKKINKEFENTDEGLNKLLK